MTRPTRYTENGSSRDWIDEFCATSTVDESRGAFRFTIGKYLRRYGKKDDPLQEAIKIQDYANRLVEFERAQVAAAKQSLSVESSMSADYSDVELHAAGLGPRDFMGNPIPFLSMPADFGQQRTIEPASLIDDESDRQKIIQQGGELAAEVYGELDCLRTAADLIDDLPVSNAEAVALGSVPQREPCKPRHRCLVCALGHATHECGAGQ